MQANDELRAPAALLPSRIPQNRYERREEETNLSPETEFAQLAT
jgi:hypothetical protein